MFFKKLMIIIILAVTDLVLSSNEVEGIVFLTVLCRTHSVLQNESLYSIKIMHSGILAM